MSKFSKIIGIAVLALLIIVPAASAQRRFGARIVVGPYGYIGPYGYWGPAYGPGYYYPWEGASPTMGEVKIDTGLKNASVYVDGGYVGSVSKFKKFGLLPGNHDIELHDSANQVIFHEVVHVIIGKTTEVRSPA